MGYCEVRGNMIICHRGVKPQLKKCEFPDCDRRGTFLCDFGDPTCDRSFCVKHGQRVASETDHCWEHRTRLPVSPEHLGGQRVDEREKRMMCRMYETRLPFCRHGATYAKSLWSTLPYLH